MTPWGPCCHTQVSNSHWAASGSSLLTRLRRSTQAPHIRLAQVMRALVVRTMSALSHPLAVATAAYVPTQMGPGSTKISMLWRACLQRKGRSRQHCCCVHRHVVREGRRPTSDVSQRKANFLLHKEEGRPRKIERQLDRIQRERQPAQAGVLPHLRVSDNVCSLCTEINVLACLVVHRKSRDEYEKGT